MDLDKALADISAIRSDVARGTEFRGYGPATVALTGVFAVLAAVLQTMWLAGEDATSYLLLWVATAAVSSAVVAVEAIIRSLRVHAGLAVEMIQSAAEHFAPAAVSAALLTLALYKFSPEAIWLLPGLWQIFFGLGVFASCRFLPRSMFAVGVWYLASGLVCISFLQGASALSPWAMGVPFGIGQLLMALVLYRAGRSFP